MTLFLGRFTLGQNLAYNHAGSMTWEAVVKLWNDEEKDFTYGTSNNKYMKVGHYTQVHTLHVISKYFKLGGKKTVLKVQIVIHAHYESIQLNSLAF